MVLLHSAIDAAIKQAFRGGSLHLQQPKAHRELVYLRDACSCLAAALIQLRSASRALVLRSRIAMLGLLIGLLCCLFLALYALISAAAWWLGVQLQSYDSSMSALVGSLLFGLLVVSDACTRMLGHAQVRCRNILCPSAARLTVTCEQTTHAAKKCAAIINEYNTHAHGDAQEVGQELSAAIVHLREATFAVLPQDGISAFTADTARALEFLDAMQELLHRRRQSEHAHATTRCERHHLGRKHGLLHHVNPLRLVRFILHHSPPH